MGKTLMGKAIARSLAGEFHRIQFTPDLLARRHYRQQRLQQPHAGVRVQPRSDLRQYRAGRRDQPGHAADASALLESMSERQVSADGQTHPLPRPFMVIATQNPAEFEGTYPLPESQLDRFLLRIPLGYPDREVELQVLSSHREGEPVDALEPRADCEQIVALQGDVRQVTVEDSINDYLLDIVQATRRCDELHVGVSTRGALALYRAAQASALVAGRATWCPTTSNGWPSPCWPIG